MAFSFGARAARAVPPQVLVPMAARAGMVGSRRMRNLAARRPVLARHLRRAAGPDLDGARLEDAVDRAFGSYGRYWAEVLRLPGTSMAQLDAGMTWEGLAHIDDAIAAGHGCILALPHLGGWEWAGKWLIGLGLPMTVVAELLEPPELFDWFASFRRQLGMTVVPLGHGASSGVLRALAANEVVCLLCDRHVGAGPGTDVEFFGEWTQLPGGPATLALRTGAALLPTAVYFGGSSMGHHATVRPPLDTDRTSGLREDVSRVTQSLAWELEGLIRREPTQWHLLQPNWPSDRIRPAPDGPE
jgi:KDO2-lipid IV(A) lauroyltransferase